MSSIKKLSIQGIRSFTCEKPESISFGSPLTLICGANGSGKTTVIECLKYATTGYLPPNSKGGAFINDPNITQRNSVTAQIKLFFVGVTGEAFIITRTMQLVKKGKDKYTFKTLENQLEKSVRGEKTSISGKSSDIDSILPQYLGLAKPILDYVVFCHQDESLWPLSEPSVLKKKFDDIFQASKFTKILDNLKVINKDLTVDIKLLEKTVEHLKIDKKRSRKIVDNLSRLKTQLDDLNEEIGNLSIEIDEKESQLEKLYNSNQDFLLVLSKYDQLTFNKTTLIQQFDRLKDSIELLPDTVQLLMEKLSNFNQVIKENTTHIEKINNENRALSIKVKDNHLGLNELNKVQGTLRFKEKQYQENVSKLKEMIPKNRDAQEFIEEVGAELKNSLQSFEQLKLENNSKKEASNKKILAIAELISNHANLRKIKEESVKEYQAKIDNLSKKINDSTLSDDLLNESKKELIEIQNKYEATKSSTFLNKLDTEINENQKKLLNLESEFDEVNKQIQAFNNQSDLMNKVNNTKETIEQLNANISSSLDGLQALIPDLSSSNYESQFKSYRTEILKELKDNQTRHDENTSALNTTKTILKLTEDQLSDSKNRLQKTKSKILSVIREEEIDSYNDILKETEDDVNNSIETLKTFEVSKDLRTKAIEVSQASHNCLLCQRNFTEEELKKFILNLNNELKNMNKEQVTQDYEDSKRDYENLKSIQSSIKDYKTLIEDVKVSEEKLKTLKNELENADLNVLNSASSLTASQDKCNRVNASEHFIEELKKLQNHLKVNNNKLESLNRQLSKLGITEAVSIDELNKLLSDINFEIKNLRSKINNDKELKFVKEKEVSLMLSAVKDMEIKIKDIESELIDLKSSQSQVVELQNSILKMQTEIEALGDKISELSKEKQVEVEKNSNLTSQLEAAEKEKQTEVDDIKSKHLNLKQAKDLIESFEKNDSPLLVQNNEDIKILNEEQESLSRLIEENTQSLKSYERKINESSNLKSTIRDNIDFQNLQKEIRTLEEEIQALDIEEAEKQKNTYQSESKKLRDRITELNSDNSYKIGQVKQIKEQVKLLKNELNAEYKDVEKQYQEEWVKLQTSMLISNDLATYSKSVDSVIMKYHSIKMEQINKMLKYLWASTYQGTDIDWIAIKSDMNNQAKNNRSYNYRVVMQKGKVELDMRGRCSAGQRVLTSILIRLTLAECFGTSCGMIALDEPTTNLDEENSRSLAESINRIVELRRAQDNFQIIIITHDQKFLSHINADSCENFFKIQRDINQASEIRAVPIFQLQDE